MSTGNQSRANRANAQRSTGPKSPAGKRVASRNSLKHGLLSVQYLLPEEDPQLFEKFTQSFVDSMQPHGPVEEMLVERIIGVSWRLKRASRMENQLFAEIQLNHRSWVLREKAKSCFENTAPSSSFEMELFEDAEEDEDDFETESRTPRKVIDQAGLENIKAQLNSIESAKSTETLRVGSTCTQTHEELAQIRRYETSLERSFYKALHELQRVQALRLGVGAPLPIAIDVHGEP